MSLRDFAKKLNEGITIKFMEGRTKGELEEIKDKNLTINNFAFLKNEEGEYAVFTVAEIPDSFYFGGLVITDYLKKIEAEEGLKEEVEQQGLPVLITQRKSKNKKLYYAIEFYPEAK